MVFKRKGRPSLYFSARLEHGRWKDLSTGTARRALAVRIAQMWHELATDWRAWDLLRQVASDQLPIGRLYDLWEATRGDPKEMRRLLADRDVVPLVEEWATWYAGQVKDDSQAHAVGHVRTLLSEGTERRVSQVTTAWLTQQLTAYPGKRNTRRKVHSSWSGFFGYLARVHGLFQVNPMDAVPRPAAEESPIRFYELDEVERIVGWQPTEERRALFAFLYGTGCEVSVAVSLTRRDFFDPQDRQVRTAGTKTSTRDRISRVAEWAWPIVWGHVQHVHPDARPWAEVSRWTASDWHRETTAGLKLPRRYPLHCARDHWAVRYLRSGGNIQVVAAQLGHRDSTLTLKKYGRFRPSTADRAKMERQAEQYEKRRRQVK